MAIYYQEKFGESYDEYKPKSSWNSDRREPYKRHKKSSWDDQEKRPFEKDKSPARDKGRYSPDWTQSPEVDKKADSPGW